MVTATVDSPSWWSSEGWACLSPWPWLLWESTASDPFRKIEQTSLNAGKESYQTTIKHDLLVQTTCTVVHTFTKKIPDSMRAKFSCFHFNLEPPFLQWCILEFTSGMVLFLMKAAACLTICNSMIHCNQPPHSLYRLTETYWGLLRDPKVIFHQIGFEF